MSWVALDVMEAGGTTKAPIFTVGVVASTFRLKPFTVTTVALVPTTAGGVNPVILGSTA